MTQPENNDNNQQPNVEEIIVTSQEENNSADVDASNEVKPVETTGDNNAHHDEL